MGAPGAGLPLQGEGRWLRPVPGALPPGYYGRGLRPQSGHDQGSTVLMLVGRMFTLRQWQLLLEPRPSAYPVHDGLGGLHTAETRDLTQRGDRMFTPQRRGAVPQGG